MQPIRRSVPTVLAVLVVPAVLTAALTALLATAPRAAARPGAALSGTVTGAASADIEVYAWPDAQSLESLPPGATVPRRLVGRTTSTAGRWQLDPAVAGLDAGYRLSDGTVDLEVDVAGLVWSVPLRPGTRHVLAVNLADGTVAADGAAPLPAGSGTSAATGSGGAKWSCSDWEGRDYLHGLRQPFMKAYGRPHAPVTVYEEVGSSHTMGTALNVNGGSWSGNGGVELETESAAGNEQRYYYPRNVGNLVNYHEWDRQCSTPPDGEYFRWWKPSSFAYLEAFWTETSAPHYTACVVQRTGSPWKSSGSNWFWHLGIDLGFFSVNTTSRYSTQTKEQWHLDGHPVQMCGSNSDGFASAPVGSAQQYVPPPPECRPGDPCRAERADS